MSDEERIEPPMAFVARLILDHLPNTGRDSNIPANQLALLLVLEGMDEGLSVGQIKTILGTAQSTTSLLVSHAQEAGLVICWRDLKDRRVTRVILSPRGKRLRMRARWRSG